jgi:hypothetical protein
VNVEDISGSALEDLVEDLSDLRHDLGKYIVFELRFLGDEPGIVDLRGALRTDLLSTRRRGDATETAWAVWARLRPPQLDGDPDVRAIDALVERLATADLDGDEESLRAVAADARAVASATRRLHRRAVEQQP